jgi:hypothetical protein
MTTLTILSTLGKKKYLEDVLVEILDKSDGLDNEQIAKQTISRLRRVYSHAVIDGTDFILVPADQKPHPTTNEKALAA